MTNPTTAFGLKPLRHQNGSPWNGQVIECYVSSAYATALYIGDPVVFTPTLAQKDATAKRPTINKSAGTAGVLARGVITGFAPLVTDRSKIHNPASTERIAYVCMDPSVIYAIRGDGGATLTSNVVGQNAVMIAKTAGSAVTGLSGMALDEGTTTAPNTTQNFTLHIVGIQNKEDNELAASMVYEVLLNTCENATGRFLGITAS